MGGASAKLKLSEHEQKGLSINTNFYGSSAF